MGTLLGIIREGGLLKHDLDVDIGVFAETAEAQKRLQQLIFSAGGVLRKQFFVSEVGLTEESYSLYGIKFDIQYYYRLNESSDVCYLFMPFNYNEESDTPNLFDE